MMGTAHILRKVLVSKHKMCNMGNDLTHHNVLHVTYSHRIAAALLTLQIWFVSGMVGGSVGRSYVTVNTIHIGDNRAPTDSVPHNALSVTVACWLFSSLTEQELISSLPLRPYQRLQFFPTCCAISPSTDLQASTPRASRRYF